MNTDDLFVWECHGNVNIWFREPSDFKWCPECRWFGKLSEAPDRIKNDSELKVQMEDLAANN